MRLLLTTIILTKLAQPVLASVEGPHPYCEEIYVKLYRNLLAIAAYERKYENKTISRTEYYRAIDPIKVDSTDWATIYNAICKE